MGTGEVLPVGVGVSTDSIFGLSVGLRGVTKIGRTRMTDVKDLQCGACGTGPGVTTGPEDTVGRWARGTGIWDNGLESRSYGILLGRVYI